MAVDTLPRTCDNSFWQSIKTGVYEGAQSGAALTGAVTAILALEIFCNQSTPTVEKFQIFAQSIIVGSVIGSLIGVVNGSIIGTVIGGLSKLKGKEKYIKIAAIVANISIWKFNWLTSALLGVVTAEYLDAGKELIAKL